MKNPERVKSIIVGAGKAGQLLAGDLNKSPDSTINVVGFIDDDASKQGKKIEGVRVLGTIEELKKVVQQNEVEEVIIALPSERGEVIRRIVNSGEGCKLVFKILPRETEVLFQDYSEDYIKHIRKVRPEDLLGGAIRKADQKELADNLRNEVVLVTGAAGSIGSELSRQLALYGSKKVVFYDWWENGMFELMSEILEISPGGNFEFVIGDMKDKLRLDAVMEKHKPTSVFHAGAYKHVPLMEDNPSEAIKNNIFGTRVVAETAIKHGVKKFILVSTDKAVNPTNIMGATKRAAEKVIHILAESQTTTSFCAVRFGNVVNSNGSAIPIFQRQIERGGPVGVTHRKVTRFFMTIPEACTLILKAWVMGSNNDLFVLDMGESIQIYDLARTLIILNGYIPDDEVMIKIIGLRPGEKLYEEVLVNEEADNATAVDKIFKTKNYMDFDKLAFMHELRNIEERISIGLTDPVEIKHIMASLEPTYVKSN